MPSKIEGELSSGETHTEPDSDTTINVVDEQSTKRVASLFAAGVTVVTTHHAEGLHGLTLNAFMVVSFDPALVLISIDSLTRSAEHIRECSCFAVNLLSDRQEFLSERFAGRAPLVNRRFDGVPHHFEVTGAPILNEALGWFDCHVEQTISAGDHTLFLGRVIALGEGPPENTLVYFNRRYRSLEP